MSIAPCGAFSRFRCTVSRGVHTRFGAGLPGGRASARLTRAHRTRCVCDFPGPREASPDQHGGSSAWALAACRAPRGVISRDRGWGRRHPAPALAGRAHFFAAPLEPRVDSQGFVARCFGIVFLALPTRKRWGFPHPVPSARSLSDVWRGGGSSKNTCREPPRRRSFCLGARSSFRTVVGRRTPPPPLYLTVTQCPQAAAAASVTARLAPVAWCLEAGGAAAESALCAPALPHPCPDSQFPAIGWRLGRAGRASAPALGRARGARGEAPQRRARAARARAAS